MYEEDDDDECSECHSKLTIESIYIEEDGTVRCAICGNPADL